MLLVAVLLLAATVRTMLEGGLETIVDVSQDKLPYDLIRDLPELLSGSPQRYALAPIGLILLIATLLPGRSSEIVEGEGGGATNDKKALKKAAKEAASIARKGMPLEAAELCCAVDLMDEAAGYFIEAEEFIRAAEIRHDQNRFLESAELYSKADSHATAATIYAQQDEFGLAAEAYVAAGNHHLAAEMFEKQGAHRRAGQCYEESGFPREAARAYSRCEEWLKAGRCLEQEILDSGGGNANLDPKKAADIKKLHRTAGGFFERAGDLEHAQKVLTKGELYAIAAEVALKRGAKEDAVELFRDAGDMLRAAEVLKTLGSEDEAARILAEHHRSSGDDLGAAAQFEAAGEFTEAADLYRLLEDYAQAGACYEKAGQYAAAAEMFRAGGDREGAAKNYADAGQFADAAECYALTGDTQSEADMLVQAGEFFRAGRIHRDHGRDEESIKALQQVESTHSDFAAASAILGEIFREREKYPVAIAKLRDATEGREIDRNSVRAFYGLATVFEATNQYAEAVDLYEKILAFDYHYEDVESRLEQCRAHDQSKSAASNASGGGSTEGRYTIRGTLGRGGMGIVYKAEDTVLDRIVAFKVLPETLKENPQALQNFLREAKSAAQLNHPNIVTVYDAGEQDGVFYIAMEYVDGNTLKDIIKKRGRISPKGTVHVLAQLAEALAYAHEKKIVHRDIKTANAMWTVDRKAKIMDFGLAKVIEEVRNHTTVVSGTPYYMSPEQTLGKNVDHRTDLYSLGVSAFEMATGTLPFTEGNIPYHHVHTPPPDPRELVVDLPADLVAVIERCLRKDPSERYQTARDVLNALRSCVS
jgi:tetratricopeptide (TPR) repeat protein